MCEFEVQFQTCCQGDVPAAKLGGPFLTLVWSCSRADLYLRRNSYLV